MDPSLAVAIVLVVAAGIALELGFSSAIAEILAGIALAAYFTGVGELQWVEFLGHLGLLGLMFLAGFEVDINRLRSTWRPSLGIGIVSLAAPMSAVFLVCKFLFDLPTPTSMLMAIGLSTTSLALVYHALKERNMLSGDLGQVMLGGATVVDILSMIALAILIGNTGWGTLVAFIVLVPTIFGLPRIGSWIFGRYKGSIVEFELRFLMVVLISTGFIAEHIGGIHPALVAFAIGLVMSEVVEEHGAVEEKLRGIVFSLLAPVFFLSAGMQIDLSLLSGEALLQFAVLFVAAVGFKFLGTALAARAMLGGSATFVGLLFNYRLSFGIITATVGLDAGLITTQQYSIILLIVVSSALLPAILLRDKPNELDGPDRGA